MPRRARPPLVLLQSEARRVDAAADEVNLARRQGPRVKDPFQIPADDNNRVRVLQDPPNRSSPCAVAEHENVAPADHHDSRHAEVARDVHGCLAVRIAR